MLPSLSLGSASAQREDVRTLYLENLLCDALIGVYDHEKSHTQKIRVDLTVRIVNPKRPLEDDFSKVLDYAFLRQSIHEIIKAKHVHLQETVCDEIADFFLRIPEVEAVYVRLGKLEAFTDCKAVGCELLRYRKP